MPPEATRLLYWDASCFTSYLERDATRVPTLRAILDQAAQSKGRLRIVTSILSRVEVAYTAQERTQQALSAEQEAAIDALWADDEVIRVVDLHEIIVREARALIRLNVARGMTGLKGGDAIHLATAKFMQAAEIHTYETRGVWRRHEAEMGCRIGEPHTDTPYLPGLVEA